MAKIIKKEVISIKRSISKEMLHICMFVLIFSMCALLFVGFSIGTQNSYAGEAGNENPIKAYKIKSALSIGYIDNDILSIKNIEKKAGLVISDKIAYDKQQLFKLQEKEDNKKLINEEPKTPEEIKKAMIESTSFDRNYVEKTDLEDDEVSGAAIMVDGKREAVFKTLAEAKAFLETLQRKLLNNSDMSKYDEIVFDKDVQILFVTGKRFNYSKEDSTLRSFLRNVSEKKEVIVNEGDTIYSIALENDKSVAEVYANNQWIVGELIHPGDEIVLQEQKKFINVVGAVYKEYDEDYKADYTIVEDDTMYSDEQELIYDSTVGRRHVFVKISSINGVERGKEILIEKILTESAPGSVRVGTKTKIDPPSVGSFIYPVWGSISCGYGGYAGHEGTDFSCGIGTPVVAADSGVITYAGYNSGGYGYLVIISHPNGAVTWYAHNSELMVEVGQYVGRGEIISYSGNTGRSTGPHLHFEIHIGGVAIDPMSMY